MTHKEIRNCIEEDIPFELFLSDGRSFEVPHRDYIFCPPRSTTIIIAQSDEDGDIINHKIPLLMVTGVSSKSKEIA